MVPKRHLPHCRRKRATAGFNEYDYPVVKIAKSELHIRREFFPMRRYHRTFFVWATDRSVIPNVTEILSGTPMVKCEQKIHGGVFHPRTRQARMQLNIVLLSLQPLKILITVKSICSCWSTTERRALFTAPDELSIN